MTKYHLAEFQNTRNLTMHFTLDTPENMLVTVYQQVEILGHFRMDWPQWPIPPKMLYSGTMGEVIEILIDYGREIMQKKKQEFGLKDTISSSSRNGT